MSVVEETLKKTILSSQEASKDIADFKEQVKEVEKQTKAKQENLLNVLASALEANNQRPLRTQNNAYVYLKQKKSDLPIVPNRMAEICDGITTAKLLQVSKDISTDTNNLPSLLDVIFVAVQQQVDDVCRPETETVSVCRRRPKMFGNVEAKDASPQVEKHVEEYLKLSDCLGVVKGQKKKGVDAFKAKERQTSDFLMKLVGSTMKDGNTPSVNMRFVPAPLSQKTVQVISSDDVASSQEKAAVMAIEGLPKVPASLEEFVGEEDDVDDDDDDTDSQGGESIVLVPGLQNTVTMHLKGPDTAATTKKNEGKIVPPKSSEFISCLTKEAVYMCIQPALIASGNKEETLHSVIKKPVTQELLHGIWTQTSREKFTMAMLELREKISANVTAHREAEKLKKASAKAKNTGAKAKEPAKKRSKN
jgi:hypothetical protein